MTGSYKRAVIGLPLIAMLTSCSIVDVPVSTAAGFGIPNASSVAFVSEEPTPNQLRDRLRNKIETELLRAGYRMAPEPKYLLEFAIANRPLGTGILLPNDTASDPEAGTWRSRPIDQKTMLLCRPSVYRLMIVISRKSTGEVVFKGSSDDDFCDEITDEKLKLLVASALTGLRLRSAT